MKSPINKAAVRKAGGDPKPAIAKTTGMSAKTRTSPIPDDRKWQVESAMQTIMRAEELKRDGKLMKDVKALAAEQAKKLAKIC